MRCYGSAFYSHPRLALQARHTFILASNQIEVFIGLMPKHLPRISGNYNCQVIVLRMYKPLDFFSPQLS
jgi:hypothetical protein